jgi:serine/threonine protein kinase/tetratricopeptide (TPR) repeat protein
MAIPLASTIIVCSTCGEPLNARGDCVACLLRTALDESVIEAKSDSSSVFGDFEIVRDEDGSFCELGRGAMGVTYLARDNVLRRNVALKVIDVPATARGSRAVRERFLREARAAAALRHPNVAAVFQFGALPNGSRCYYAMELVEGETLESRIRREGPLGVKLVLEIAIQISRALSAAAAHSLIHRDLKPANIMLTRGDAEAAQLEVKVIDFGLAKAIADAGGEMGQTHEGFIGTPNFASPEQFETGPVDARSDMYSLGATLWFALTGRTPFTGRDIEEIRLAHESEPLPIEQLKAARVPSRLRSLLKSMLEIEPAARPGVRDLGPELRHCSAQANSENIRRRRITLAGSLILIFGVTAFFIFPSLRTTHRPVVTGGNSSSNPPVTEKSIAVLPFENASNESNTEYLSEGISEALINSLSELPQLRVIARPTAFRYKRKNVDPRQVGRELGVAAVLTGRVRQMQDALNVQVDLMDPVTGAQIWGAGYDRKIADLVAVKQAIAQEVAATLKLKLSTEEQQRLLKRDSTNAEAYQFYLRGRYFWNKRTSDGLKTSIGYFNQAIKGDPAYAPAYAGLADAYAVLPNYSQTPGKEAYAKAEAAAEKALEIDDSLAEAHISLANVRLWHRWGNGAEPEFKRGLELNPNYSTGHQWYSIYLSVIGRNEDAIVEMEKAKELDPFSIIINTEVGCPYLYSKHYDRAIESFRKAIEMDPAFPFAHFALAEAYDRKGSYKEAMEEHDKAIELARRDQAFDLAGGDAPRAWYALTGRLQNTYRALGGANYWQGQLESARRSYEKGTTTATAVAEIEAILGDNEQALAWLKKAYQEADDFLVFIGIQPQFENLRSDARYQGLLPKMFHISPHEK